MVLGKVCDMLFSIILISTIISLAGMVIWCFIMLGNFFYTDNICEKQMGEGGYLMPFSSLKHSNCCSEEYYLSKNNIWVSELRCEALKEDRK